MKSRWRFVLDLFLQTPKSLAVKVSLLMVTLSSCGFVICVVMFVIYMRRYIHDLFPLMR